MSKKKPVKSRCISIIGGGPRGTSALESLYLALSEHPKAEVWCTLLFEATDNPGGGRVYHLNQADSNWLNISERALKLEGRPSFKIKNTTIPSFPSYHDWANLDYHKIKNKKPDNFPPRSKLGKYLKERYQTISEVLQDAGWLTVIQEEVEKITFVDQKLKIETADGNAYAVEEALLTIGHQSTKLSPQIKDWAEHVKQYPTGTLFKQAYPIQQFLESTPLNKDSTIALRGFGLAMIDVVRGILEGTGGTFELKDKSTQSYTYTAGKNSPKHFIPFSLDGLPTVPKPLNAQIDKWFEPTKKQLKTFCKSLKKSNHPDTKGNYFLIMAMAKLAAQIFKKLGKKAYAHELNEKDLALLTAIWLADDKKNHHLFVAQEQSRKEMMQAFVKMATGQKKISLDYCIGQVWRHCQPSIYKLLSFSNLKDEVMAAVIALDEQMKRYAYGPPVASIQQMLSLIEAAVLDLTYINDPDIKLVEKGWALSEKENTITVDVMIDTVLDSPKLLAVNTPLITHLLASDLIQPIHSQLGVLTDKNGYIQSELKDQSVPIALLGRLAKGTVIGVDAILECFGLRSEHWATTAVKKHIEQS